MEAIKIENLTKQYKDVVAVDHLSLTAYKGEILSLLGVNGAGKTTTIKMLSCLTKPTRGDAFLNEKSICKALGGKQNSNSGAGNFHKGDVIIPEASLLIEAKCCMSPKASVSIKKEWIEKNKQEALFMGKEYSAIAINFGPDEPNYYVINEYLFQDLIEYLQIKKERN